MDIEIILFNKNVRELNRVKVVIKLIGLNGRKIYYNSIYFFALQYKHV